MDKIEKSGIGMFLSKLITDVNMCCNIVPDDERKVRKRLFSLRKM